MCNGSLNMALVASIYEQWIIGDYYYIGNHCELYIDLDHSPTFKKNLEISFWLH